MLSSLGWRWMFWIVLPLSLAALVIGAIWTRLDSETRKVRPAILLSLHPHTVMGTTTFVSAASLGSEDPSAAPDAGA